MLEISKFEEEDKIETTKYLQEVMMRVYNGIGNSDG